MRIKMYSQDERERLHPEGLDMPFGGGAYFMRPETAEALAYGLVERDRASGCYRRVQLTEVDEREIIGRARDRERAKAVPDDNSQPAPWGSSRP